MRATTADIDRLAALGATVGKPPRLPDTGPEPLPTRKSKYRALKTVVGDKRFDSKKEAATYVKRRLQEQQGEIQDLRLQAEYRLEVNGELICKYKADFVYVENNELVVEDVKSDITRKLPVYRIKKKLMKAIYGIEIRET